MKNTIKISVEVTLKNNVVRFEKLQHVVYRNIYIRIIYIMLNPQALAAQKTADEVVFRRFQGEGVEFL